MDEGSGSHNESTEPEGFGNHKVEETHDKHTAAMKRFWSKFVVPKAHKNDEASSQDDSKGSRSDTTSHTSAEAAPLADLEGLPEPEPELDFDRTLAKIDPSWGGAHVTQVGGRTFVEFSDYAEYTPTQHVGSPWSPTFRGSTPPSPTASIKFDDTLSDDGDTSHDDRYNPQGKADVMPPCGKFGMESSCKGKDCVMCKEALRGDPNLSLEESQIVKASPATLKRPWNPSLSSAMKTPPSKKPDFFGEALVETPEKECQKSDHDDHEARFWF